MASRPEVRTTGGKTLPLKDSNLHISRLTSPDSSRVYPHPFYFSPEMVPQGVRGYLLAFRPQVRAIGVEPTTRGGVTASVRYHSTFSSSRRPSGRANRRLRECSLEPRARCENTLSSPRPDTCSISLTPVQIPFQLCTMGFKMVATRFASWKLHLRPHNFAWQRPHRNDSRKVAASMGLSSTGSFANEQTVDEEKELTLAKFVGETLNGSTSVQ